MKERKSGFLLTLSRQKTKKWCVCGYVTNEWKTTNLSFWWILAQMAHASFYRTDSESPGQVSVWCCFPHYLPFTFAKWLSPALKNIRLTKCIENLWVICFVHAKHHYTHIFALGIVCFFFFFHFIYFLR